MDPGKKLIRPANPKSSALGELSRALELFTDVSLDIRSGWVNEMKDHVHLIDLNMQVLAAVLILIEKLEYNIEEDQLDAIVEFLSNVDHNINTTNINPDQRLYNQIAAPLLEDAYRENLPESQLNDIEIKMKATILRYATNVYIFRNPTL